MEDMEFRKYVPSVKEKGCKVDGHTRQDREGQVGGTFSNVSDNLKQLLQ